MSSGHLTERPAKRMGGRSQGSTPYQRLVTYRNKQKRNDVDVDGFSGKRVFLPGFSECIFCANKKQMSSGHLT
ncbi:MAG: hypothetical protein ACI9XB_004628 [Gammaproteobacteria bacterium]|jgi:hypothetical protein